MTHRINLQNTATSADVAVEAVAFDSHGAALSGALYKPAQATRPLPAAIVTGAWTTVKEQMAGAYARELAARGVAALAFDFAGWGESAGDPRYVEDPAVKTADIHAAAGYMAGRSDIDADCLAGVGVCASSGYMAEAVADNDKLAKLALVAPWLHDAKIAEAIYGGPEAVTGLIAASDAARGSDQPTVLTAASLTDETSPMRQAPYYTEADRGLIPEYDNQFSVLSWRPWLTYDAHASAARLKKPTLMAGSPGMALPEGAALYEARMSASLEKVWFGEDVDQFDFYDRADIVAAVADALARFFKGGR